MDRFDYFENQSFRHKNVDEKTKSEMIVFKNDLFLTRFLKTVVFIKFFISLTIVNNVPLYLCDKWFPCTPG